MLRWMLLDLIRSNTVGSNAQVIVTGKKLRRRIWQQLYYQKAAEYIQYFLEECCDVVLVRKSEGYSSVDTRIAAVFLQTT